jgi:general secretion pathway protein A
MYNEFFGVQKDPFGLTPDPSFLFLTDQHREALSGLTLALLQRKGLVILCGEVGTGKTTLLARMLRFLPASRLQFAMIVNPTLTPAEFLELVLLDFGITDIPPSKAERVSTLLSLILQGKREEKVTVLIVDEAHLLPLKVLDEIRMLCSMEDPEDRFLQILLVGQPELDKVLGHEDMRQLRQQIGVRLTLGPLADAEVSEYIRHRWLRAGGAEPPFTPRAIDVVSTVTANIPRLINLICGTALIAAAADKVALVDERHIRQAAAKLSVGELPRPVEFVSPEVAVPAPGTAPAQGAEDIALMAAPETASSRWSRFKGKLRPTPPGKQLIT